MEKLQGPINPYVCYFLHFSTSLSLSLLLFLYPFSRIKIWTAFTPLLIKCLHSMQRVFFFFWEILTFAVAVAVARFLYLTFHSHSTFILFSLLRLNNFMFLSTNA